MRLSSRQNNTKKDMIKQRGGRNDTSVGVEYVIHERKEMVEFLQLGIEVPVARGDSIVFPIRESLWIRPKTTLVIFLLFKLNGRLGNIYNVLAN